MPLFVQPKLLRALQEKTISRIGSERSLGVDVRLVCATNRDLIDLAAAGQFREDLYFRVKVLEIEIPPNSSSNSGKPLGPLLTGPSCSSRENRK